jgi:hypothetical protein
MCGQRRLPLQHMDADGRLWRKRSDMRQWVSAAGSGRSCHAAKARCLPPVEPRSGRSCRAAHIGLLSLRVCSRVILPKVILIAVAVSSRAYIAE